ncbi:MAG: hypothetical protein ACOYJL_03965 [Tractidigestivibacter sp.]|jgi:hypothetical protein|uniref:hypothetical protein n=1 Tax=Tractidigestivibacter sp. TaxID=2847320 RepID=UPI003D8EEA6A
MIGLKPGGKPTRGGNGGHRLRAGLDLFIDDEGGYTTVTVAVALLVSLSLVFAAASAEWVMARSYEVQPVADAAALAGENAVASYVTIAKVLDSCVLSMGLAGLLVLGAGLVMSCIPVTSALGAEVCQAGGKILDARRSFSQSASEGLQRLEKLLPTIVVANSASCVSANSDESGISYVGCAIPLPTESMSDFSSLASDVESAELSENAKDLQDASGALKDAQDRANEARHRGWEADCGSKPYCLQERAASLAGLSGSQNPFYPSEESWTFGAPLLRARCYYASRLATESPASSSVEDITESSARREFYRYALAEVNRGSYVENPDGSVDIDLPSLPHNAEETRACSLYTDSVWPCTQEEGGRTLHSSLSCPGAAGSSLGTASLADLDSGAVLRCETCQMDVGVMGRVAAASTSTSNGFEHYWRQIVEASKDYESAHDDQAEAEGQLKDIAKETSDSFSKALDQLSAVRPTICPPGAWGCVAVVARQSSTTIPTELTASFLSSGELPPGAAVSAAALAPDDSTADNNVLASFFDGVAASGAGSAAGGALDGVFELWGSLLVNYGASYDAVSSTAGNFLDRVDGVFGGTTGAWLKQKMKSLVEKVGMQPVDMRLMKPVLAGTSSVLGKAGYDDAAQIRKLVEGLPSTTSTRDLARELGVWLIEDKQLGKFTIATITIPGTDVSYDLTIDLTDVLVGLARAA